METVEYDPDYLFLKMRSAGVTFYVEAPNEKLAAGLNAHAIGARSQAVFHVNDLLTEMQRLQTLGIAVIVPPTKQYYGGFDAIIADPDGNEFILHEKSEEDEE
jgi:predicted enzyme related to lactoylglutathione lyase